MTAVRQTKYGNTEWPNNSADCLQKCIVLAHVFNYIFNTKTGIVLDLFLNFKLR